MTNSFGLSVKKVEREREREMRRKKIELSPTQSPIGLNA
jgi:hypothetical protein